MEAKLGLRLSDWLMNELYQRETIDALETFWIPQTALNWIDFQWFTNWEIVLQDQQLSIGGIGFGGSPDNDGQVSIGYALDKAFWGNGYASEAVKAMIGWAKEDLLVKKILAETPLDNIASQRVLEKNSFLKVGQGTAQHTELLEVFSWELSLRR
jgi:RimJ/RimL family protein N-acetyltransferase